jgi:ribonuclease HII
MPEMIMENKADLRYPVVAAASIIAKVERDRDIEELRKEHGNIGSGYPSDEVTISWLKNHLEDKGKFPDFVRRTWMTAEIMEKEKSQTRIGSFFKGLVSKK